MIVILKIKGVSIDCKFGCKLGLLFKRMFLVEDIILPRCNKALVFYIFVNIRR